MRRLALLVCIASVPFAVLTADPAEARRIALVIGNTDYRIGPLGNPVNDAVAVAEAFEKQLRFDKVILKKNLDFNGFRLALIEIGREAAGAELGVVYFAGHGTEVGGRNYLLPVDAVLSKAADLPLEAVPLDTVLSQLSGVRKLKLVILDACRDSLFPLAGAERSRSRGLARVEPEDNNTVIAYAAKHGTTAADGAGRSHSPFTQALLKHMVTPGLEIRFLLGEVRDEVMASTQPVQQPHVYQSLGREKFFLLPPLSARPEAERAWAGIKDTTSVAVLEAFIARYGDAFEADLARLRVEELRKQQVAMLPRPAPVETSKPIAPPRPRIEEVLAEARRRIEAGDIAGARAYLTASESVGPALIAFALAETYDPNMLAAWQARGVAAEHEKARTLYRKALDLGDSRARERLDRLIGSLPPPPPGPEQAAAATQVRLAKPAAPTKTDVRDTKALAKLLGKRRLSLQWISWDYFGTVTATESKGLIRLDGEQRSRSNSDFVRIEGVVTTIEASSFKLLGKVTQQVDFLNGGQPCVRDGLMTFAITQNRKYWRLQEMGSCDDATDYVDIFF